MAEPSNLPSTPKNVSHIDILGAKPTTPLLLPPPQINHSAGHNPSTTSLTIDTNNDASDSQITASSSDDDDEAAVHSHNNKPPPSQKQKPVQHRRRTASQRAAYRAPMLQPNMGPIINSPLLNPLFSVNSADTPSMTPTMHQNDSFSRSLPHHKYTKVITTHPCQPSMDDDEITSTDFRPASKPLRIVTATEHQHDEDQKIVESINILRDEHMEYRREQPHHNSNTHTNNHHNKYIAATTQSSPVIPVRGIPTTPSYPTPITGPQPHHMRYLMTHTPTSAHHSQPLPAQTGSPHSIPPSHLSAPMTTSYRKPSQFMNTQQHRKRTHKLKFTRAKWSEHGKRVLLNTTVRVDRVCHTLVQTRQRFGVCPVEMRELSLTVAVIERAMYSYGRQVQEYKQKVNIQRTRSSHRSSASNYYSSSAMHIPSTAHTNPAMRLGASMDASISAPSHYASLEHAKETLIQMEHLSDGVHSEDSNETIGKCTNTSIVTGTTYVRTNSPMNHAKLARYQRNIQHYNNASSPPHHSQRSHAKRHRNEEQSIWRHPGGVVSLLEILGRVLRSTEEQLIAIGNIASLTDFVQKNKMIWVICFVAGGYICAVPFRGPIQLVLEQCSSLTRFLFGRMIPSGAWKGLMFIINYMVRHVLFRFIPYRFRSRLSVWIRYLFGSAMSMLDRITAIESVSFWMNRFRFMILPTLIYMLHKMVLRVYLERLRKLQNELKTIILHWQLCMTAITPRHRLDQSLSDRLYRVNQSEEADNGSMTATSHSHSKIDIYQWILRLVPPSAHIDACFWYRANTRLMLLRKLMDVNYAVTSYYYRIFGSSTLLWPCAFPILMYYILNPHRAACRANEFLANPDIRIIRVLYSLLDSKLARWITLKLFPKMRLMPSLKTAITFEIRVDDINDDDALNMNCGNMSGVMSMMHSKYDVMDDDMVDNVAGLPWLHNIDTVRIKIFSTKKLNIKPDCSSGYGGDGDVACAVAGRQEFLNERVPVNLILNAEQNALPLAPARLDAMNANANANMGDTGSNNSSINTKEETEPINPNNPIIINPNKTPTTASLSPAAAAAGAASMNKAISAQENGVIFYIHGGGFLGNFCASDLRILSQWSDLVNAPIVEVDYSLMPSKWPQQLAEAILAYKCLCYGRLGFNARRIAVIGDSNGGGLAVSMVINIIQCGLRVPDVLILTSPILSLRQNLPTTSRLLFNMDPLVPMNLIVQLTKYYLIPTICDDENDPLISPLIAAPDYLLSSFPPTTIVVGGLDPFLDDSIDFAHRLSNADVNVDVKLKIYKFAPHAFLNFNYILPDVNHAIHLIAECIDQAFLN